MLYPLMCFVPFSFSFLFFLALLSTSIVCRARVFPVLPPKFYRPVKTPSRSSYSVYISATRREHSSLPMWIRGIFLCGYVHCVFGNFYRANRKNTRACTYTHIVNFLGKDRDLLYRRYTSDKVAYFSHDRKSVSSAITLVIYLFLLFPKRAP